MPLTRVHKQRAALHVCRLQVLMCKFLATACTFCSGEDADTLLLREALEPSVS